MGGEETARPPTAAPVAKNKWVTASVVDDAAQVLRDVFDEAERRDPTHTRTWVALVDGNNHQINRIEAKAADRGVEVTVVVDLIHVLEYLWGAAWCFFDEADPAAEAWVRHRALAVLDGKARQVATGIRRRTRSKGMAPTQRTKADACARYLINKANYLDYPTALASGWPIATGVIEGACPDTPTLGPSESGVPHDHPRQEATMTLKRSTSSSYGWRRHGHAASHRILRGHDGRSRTTARSTQRAPGCWRPSRTSSSAPMRACPEPHR